MNNSTAIDLPRVQADLLFWGFLPESLADSGNEAQNYRFERVLPLSVEQLHTVRTPWPLGGVVIIGIELERLNSHLATRSDVTPSTWDLIPDRLPPFLAEQLPADQHQIVLEQLNVLQGCFEPQPRRRLRLRTVWIINIGLLFAALFSVIGIERRVANLHRQADLLRDKTRALIASAIPVAAKDSHPELRLTMELRRLEQTIGTADQSSLSVIDALSDLWRTWPRDMRTQIDAVSAMQDRLVIRGHVPSLAEAEQLAQTCRKLDPALRLRAEPLQAQKTERGASFLLTFLPNDSTGGQP